MEKYITIGIAGHIDHGKTSLVRTLTGIDTDRLDEEKRRGISIESGVAPLFTALPDFPSLWWMSPATPIFSRTPSAD